MKYKYDKDKLYFSPGWRTADFRSADRNREIERAERKQKNADGLGTLFQFIDDNEICSFAVFMREIYKQCPNLKELAVQNHGLLRDYIRDKRYDVACGFADLDYKTVCKQLKQQRAENYELENRISELWDTIKGLTAEREKFKEKSIEQSSILEDTNRLNRTLLLHIKELQEMLEFEKIL